MENKSIIKQNVILKPETLMASVSSLYQLKRQEQLSKLDVEGALDRLEEGLDRLNTKTDVSGLDKFGREVDLGSREVVLYLIPVIAFSNDFGCDEGYIDWIKYNYDRATKLIQNANQFFKKYSGWPFDFFSKCARERLKSLEYTAETCQPVLLRRSKLLKGY